MESKYPDSGALFFNDPSRKTNPNQPDYSGKLEISSGLLQHLLACERAGQPAVIDLSGWMKIGKSGKKFLSLKGSAAWDGGRGRRQAQPQSEPKPQSTGFDSDDEIPF